LSANAAIVKSIFLELVALNEPEARAARLDDRCGADSELRAQVSALLAANDQAALNEGTASFAPDAAAGTEELSRKDEQVGAVLAGKYKLIEEIGEGGMGSVFLAQQNKPVKRPVAVKVIKQGMDSRAVLARFEAERQALAMMDHPNISRVLDAGTTAGGRPFFVMELVKGVPITQYCDDHKLTPRQRLELFIPVCNAVQHAHQKGIIHRDIKPSNVLVALYDDRPVPKVIDFGVAKAAGQSLTDKTLMTGFGAVVGTPEYMSPEQANLNNLDVDTRSDVYSLGVLLYELLTGTTPVDRLQLGHAAILEILRIVREVEAPMPSVKLSTIDSLPSVAANRGTDPGKLSNLMKGELDWVVLKALEKDRTRRYDSAHGLARDIQRYLADEVVEARPPTTRYRLRKFVKRHKGQVVAAALFVTALLAGIIGTTWGLVEARRQGQIALAEVRKQEAARKKTREALDTLTADGMAAWYTRERDLTPEQKAVLPRLLDLYEEFAEESGESGEDRRGQVRALIRVGKLQQALGDRAAAGRSLGRAAALAGTTAKPITDDVEGLQLVADTHTSLFEFYLAGRLLREAEPHAREAQAARIKVLATNPGLPSLRYAVANGHVNLAAVLGDQNRLELANGEHAAAVAELEKLVQEFPQEKRYARGLANELSNRSLVVHRQGRLTDALADIARAIAMRRQQLRENPNQAAPTETLLKALNIQFGFLNLAGRPTEAEPIIREAIQLGLELSDAFPSMPRYRVQLANNYEELAKALLALGQHPAALEEARRAGAVARAVANEFPDDLPPGRAIVSSLVQLSLTLTSSNSFQEAERAARAALAESTRLHKQFGKQADLLWVQAEALRVLGQALHGQARYAEEAVAQQNLISAILELPRDNPELHYWKGLTMARLELANSLVRSGQLKQAETELRAAGANLDKLFEHDRENLTGVYYFEMAILTVEGSRWREADEWTGLAIEVFAKRYQANPTLAQNRDFLVQSHWHRATAREKLDRYAEAAGDWKEAAKLADIPMDAAFYRAHHGAALAKAGRLEDAATELAAAVAQADAALKLPNPRGVTYFDAATVFALAAQASKDPPLIDRYGSEAVRRLGQAAAANYLADPGKVQALRTDKEYDTLRVRKDFQTLITSLQKAPQPKPPPKINPTNK
jgi:eukaryotic-like serine/threonine-protein kinase